MQSFIATLTWLARRAKEHGNRCAAALTMSQRGGPDVHGEFDRDSFRATLNVFALKVPPKLCNDVRSALKAHTLYIPRVSSVVKTQSTTPTQNSMLLLLKYLSAHPESKRSNCPLGNMDSSLVNADPEQLAEKLRQTQLSRRVAEDARSFIFDLDVAYITTRAVHLTYEHWNLDAVLRSLLPDQVVVPTSFETIGHIAHLNLREEHYAYKTIIARAMLDKLQPRIRTVVNKLQSLGGPYRTFAMEILAGDQELETSVKENGCTFTLNFARVYWNSRLETEHRRIIDSLRPDDILADAFAGVGPFTVPASKQNKCAAVYANDLNPTSVEYLRLNAAKNAISPERFHTSCSCARVFLRELIRDKRVPVTQVVMNFPSGAPEFLDTFRGLYKGMEHEKMPLPTIHCYCFVKQAQGTDEARTRMRKNLFGTTTEAELQAAAQCLPDSDVLVREVRDVAPKKHQVCITFTLPSIVAYEGRLESGFSQGSMTEVEPPHKRQRVISTG